MTYEKYIQGLCKTDSSIVIMTAENRAAIRNIQEELGQRLIDTGIAEQTMVGMAAGLALCGKKPILHALATFLTTFGKIGLFLKPSAGHTGLKLNFIH